MLCKCRETLPIYIITESVLVAIRQWYCARGDNEWWEDANAAFPFLLEWRPHAWDEILTENEVGLSREHIFH